MNDIKNLFNSIKNNKTDLTDLTLKRKQSRERFCKTLNPHIFQLILSILIKYELFENPWFFVGVTLQHIEAPGGAECADPCVDVTNRHRRLVLHRYQCQHRNGHLRKGKWSIFQRWKRLHHSSLTASPGRRRKRMEINLQLHREWIQSWCHCNSHCCFWNNTKERRKCNSFYVKTRADLDKLGLLWEDLRRDLCR